MKAEEWRAIPGFEGRYEVSDHGRVRSLDREAHFTYSDGTPSWRRAKGQLLRPGLTSAKYLSVMLGRKTHLVHRIVALTFIGPCPKGKEVCHNDGNRTNNRAINLRYDTRRENVADTIRQGKKPKNFRLRPCQELLVAVRYRAGERSHDLAKEFCINFNTVYNINRRIYG
jgi:hypothetical protein